MRGVGGLVWGWGWGFGWGGDGHSGHAWKLMMVISMCCLFRDQLLGGGELIAWCCECRIPNILNICLEVSNFVTFWHSCRRARWIIHKEVNPNSHFESMIMNVDTNWVGTFWWIRRNANAGSLSNLTRTLSGSASLLSRPEFTLMRRVRDSGMFMAVNSLTILALSVAGVIFWLLSTDPVQTLLRVHVYPMVWEVVVGT